MTAPEQAHLGEGNDAGEGAGHDAGTAAPMRRSGTERAGEQPPDGAPCEVSVADSVDDELIDAFERLIPQLSSSSPPPSRGELEDLIAAPNSLLFIARSGGAIVGSLTLALYRIPTGVKAWIEDVVVDTNARGLGVGDALNRAALSVARERGAKNVSLTSRPSREAANRLYQRIGFEPYDTNLYRFKL